MQVGCRPACVGGSRRREEHSAGRYQMTWDGTDGQGALVAPGAYILELKSSGDGGDAVVRRLVSVAY